MNEPHPASATTSPPRWSIELVPPWNGHEGQLAPVPGGWTTKRYQSHGRDFRLTVPAQPDALLDDPVVLEANRRDDYMPYWGYLWQAAYPMAADVLLTDWTAGAEALEIGCGIGLVGLSAAAKGLKVTFSDYDADSVALAVHNARQNDFHEVEGLVLDWRTPLPRQFPVIFGSDVTYERRNHEPILDVLDAMLTADGVCWIGDAGRQVSAGFVPLARSRGYRVELFAAGFHPIPEPQIGEFQLFKLRRS